MHQSKEAVNEYGMTFNEWYYAASLRGKRPTSVANMRAAWRRGEDPSDYRRAVELRAKGRASGAVPKHPGRSAGVAPKRSGRAGASQTLIWQTKDGKHKVWLTSADQVMVETESGWTDWPLPTRQGRRVVYLYDAPERIRSDVKAAMPRIFAAVRKGMR